MASFFQNGVLKAPDWASMLQGYQAPMDFSTNVSNASARNAQMTQGASAKKTGSTTSKVNFRKSPDSKSKTNIIRLLAKGTTFNVVGIEGGWVQIEIGGEQGYISKSYTDLCVSASKVAEVSKAGNQAGIKGTADAQKTDIARYNPDDNMFENVTRAVSAVETAGGYGIMGDINDGAGLSVGGFQFTEKSSLHGLVKKYQDMGGKVQFSETLMAALAKAKDPNNRKMLTLSQRREVQSLLQKAYDTDKKTFIAAQKMAWKEMYFDPCTDRMKRYGLNPDTLDPKICVLIYDHENSGSGNNEKLMKILAKNTGDATGKRITQSKLTLENVAKAIQQQFAGLSNYGRWGKGWNNRVMTLYAAMQLPQSGGPTPTATTTPATTIASGQATAQQAPEVPAASADPAVEYPNIDVAAAISYNTKRNPGMLEYLQTYLGIAKTNEYDEITVKSIAKWQKDTKGVLKVDGKFGDKSYEYAMDNGLRQIMPTMLDEVVITGKKGGASTNDGDGGGSAGGGDGKEDKPVPETPEVASSGDWKKDLISAGLADNEIYEGDEALTYGHEFIKDKSKRPNRGSYKATVGKEVTNGSAKIVNAVKTLQALLNRSLKETGLPKANADSTKIVEAGKLVVDGKWNANTVAHLVYFIDAAGYNVDNHLAKYTVKCPAEIWKDLRNKKSLNISKVKESVDSSQLANVGGSHKIVHGGEKAYNKMNKDSGNSLGISSSFRSFSSHGMAKAGLPNNTGQLELFALRVAGVKDSDAAVPTHTPSGASHMTGKALDIKTGKSWVTNNGSAYGFTGITSENWHFNFDPATWAKSPKNPDRNNK